MSRFNRESRATNGLRAFTAPLIAVLALTGCAGPNDSRAENPYANDDVVCSGHQPDLYAVQAGDTLTDVLVEQGVANGSSKLVAVAAAGIVEQWKKSGNRRELPDSFVIDGRDAKTGAVDGLYIGETIALPEFCEQLDIPTTEL